MLKSYHYSGGSFEVTDGDYYAEVPIMFDLILAPGQDPVHLETAGKILSVWIASEFGKERGDN